MKIITCNIRFSSMKQDTGPRFWQNRKKCCFSAIEKYNPDVICLQECHNEQLADFKAYFSNYDCVHGNSFASEEYPENAIFYRREIYENCGIGAWQLSETPHIPGSTSWGTKCVRMVNWVLLRGPKGFVRVVNTHFDHISQLARDNAARMINEDAAAWKESIVQILTGDLNCDPDNTAITSLVNSSWIDTMPQKDMYSPTFHDYIGTDWKEDLGICGKGRMDYIFVRGIKPEINAQIVYDHEDEVFPSDHFFVFSDQKDI
jgi:endonuclease/exonuclease/phosphatase family metal-dependent hydrolase